DADRARPVAFVLVGGKPGPADRGTEAAIAELRDGRPRVTPARRRDQKVLVHGGAKSTPLAPSAQPVAISATSCAQRNTLTWVGVAAAVRAFIMALYLSRALIAWPGT